MVELTRLANRFKGRCRSWQDYEDLKQDIYLIYLQHADSFDESKACLNTWVNGYLFKKVLTYLDSAPVRNTARFIPTENLPEIKTYQPSLDLIRKLKSLTKDDWYAINKYDKRLPHHRKGPFARNIGRIKKDLEEECLTKN